MRASFNEPNPAERPDIPARELGLGAPVPVLVTMEITFALR
jgi:hypothetical protein